MDIFGTIENAKTGDELTVFTGKGIMCGKFTIKRGDGV